MEYYSTEDGLSHPFVTSMIKDQEGFMWFGSWDGINRFDGHSFVTYKSSAGDRSELKNDRIDQIVEDQSNHLWLMAYDKQIYSFDKGTEQILPLSSLVPSVAGRTIAFNRIWAATAGSVWLASEADGLFCLPQSSQAKGHFVQYRKGTVPDFALPSNNIVSFREDNEHRIWVGTSEGIACLVRSASGKFINQKLPPALAAGRSITTQLDDNASLFFGTAAGSLLTYDKRTGSLSARKISKGSINALRRSRIRNVLYATTSLGELVTLNLQDQTTTTLRYPSGEALNTIYEDRTGALWLEPEQVGVIRFDPANGSFRSFSHKVEDHFNSFGNRFRVLEDNSGLVWVNMKGGGFGYYNPATASLDYTIQTSDNAAFHLPDVVFGIYYDPAGILWLRVNGRELVKIILQGNDFRQQLVAAPEAPMLDNEVRSMLYDRKGRLWLGAKNGKLHVFQHDQEITGLFENEPAGGLGQAYSLIEDSRGNIWIGTKGNGLYKASPVNKEGTRYRLTSFAADKARKDGLPGNQIYALLEDRQHRIWVGTFDEGLALLAGEGDSLHFIHSGKAFQNYPKDGFRKIRHMTLDGAGNIWIGTTDGLLVVDADDRHSPLYRYATFSKISGDAQSLGNNNIMYVFRDSKNRMWLATAGGGLDQALGNQPFESLRFRNYTTKDGLPNDYVLGCAEDRQGDLWIATENGLAKFNPGTGSFRNYDSYDGLPKEGFSESTCGRLADGRLVFGLTKGYLSFDPGRISVRRMAANLALTNLQINNEDAGPGLLNANINYLQALRLKYNQNIISIDYAVLDYRSGDRQEYAYRLIGFDTTWHNNKQQRRATYTNLPPGHYVFEVKALTSDLYSDTPYRRLEITILPPPWRTWWAYLIYVLLFGLLLETIRRNSVTMLRLRNNIAVEKKLAALKMSFFTNVSHELRTPLTLILGPIEQLSRREKLSAEGAALVEVVRKNADRMVRFINQLLDLRKVQSNKATLRLSRVEIVSFVKKIGAHFTEAARSKRIRLEILSEEKELLAWVDAEKIDVVIYNLLGNALKFTPEGKAIRVHIRQMPEAQSFAIEVEDQGPGVAPEELEAIFRLYYEGAQPGGRVLKGTGIGLALSKELVELHGGAIRASNNAEGGLTVSVCLKLGRDHYQANEVTYVDQPSTPVTNEKPIEQQLLPQPQYAHGPRAADAPLVLLVEDNAELSAFLKAQLGEVYRVEVAANGAEGWQKAVQFLPDLIVSDIMMPVMDGIQLLDKLKNDLATSHIPVVLLSAKYSVESQIEGLKYGADYYITKPFNNEFLLASIDNLLRQRKKLFERILEKKKTVDLSPQPVVITSKDEAFLKEVIKIVEEGMGNPDFNIDTVAEGIGMSRTAFYKKFRSLTNLAPVEFVREMRLQRAKQYLDSGAYNISEVAYMVGFSNPKYFSTCFREKYQVSPSEYLKSKAV